MGAASKKPTYIWSSGLREVQSALLKPNGKPKYVCPGASSLHKHINVRDMRDKAVRYHKRFVELLTDGIKRSFD